ncbi:17335_t:CDS:1, partial [Racocetra persica]
LPPCYKNTSSILVFRTPSIKNQLPFKTSRGSTGPKTFIPKEPLSPLLNLRTYRTTGGYNKQTPRVRDFGSAVSAPLLEDHTKKD